MPRSSAHSPSARTAPNAFVAAYIVIGGVPCRPASDDMTTYPPRPRPTMAGRNRWASSTGARAVDRDDPAGLLGVEVQERPDRGVGGVGHHQPDLRSGRRRHDRVESLGGGQVGRDRTGLRRQRGGEGGQRVGPAGGQHHVEPAPGEFGREGGAQPFGGTRHQRPRAVPLREAGPPHAAIAAGGWAARRGVVVGEGGTGSWNGWSRRIRQIIRNGMSSQAPFAARMMAKFLAGVTP